VAPTIHRHLEPGLKKEQGYTSTPFFAFMEVYRMDFKSTFLCRPSLRVIVEPPVSGRMQIDGRIKADSHIACHSHAAPMPFPCHAVPLKV